MSDLIKSHEIKEDLLLKILDDMKNLFGKMDEENVKKYAVDCVDKLKELRKRVYLDYQD